MNAYRFGLRDNMVTHTHIYRVRESLCLVLWMNFYYVLYRAMTIEYTLAKLMLLPIIKILMFIIIFLFKNKSR